ncbi:MAG: hypothetical protein HZC52_03175 [Planctomycetes bacterium]|nr:hypothetical protein [Planctomycetota bacterium]
MEFTLYYRGYLKANSRPKEKQELRRYFHAQLKRLWHQIPLKERHEPDHQWFQLRASCYRKAQSNSGTQNHITSSGTSRLYHYASW